MVTPMTDEERQRAKERATANSQSDAATIVITDTVEHEDGSATYTFDMDDKSSKKITELGLEFILTCAAFGLDVQDALGLISREGKLKQNQSEEAK